MNGRAARSLTAQRGLIGKNSLYRPEKSASGPGQGNVLNVFLVVFNFQGKDFFNIVLFSLIEFFKQLIFVLELDRCKCQ